MTSDLGRASCVLIAASVVFAEARAGAEARNDARAASEARSSGPVVNDAHVHLTNYVQEGPGVEHLLSLMGDQVERAALFGTPLQQLWSARVSGDYGPTSYLSADSSLYYYSFSDAVIATAYKALSKAEQARFDPMITGFNPADMYAADHIRRVLQTFPGVFSGVGEITIHREFVSSKVAGEVPSLMDPALDRVLDFCAEAGLVVLLHNDMDVPYPKPDAAPAYLAQMKDLLQRHPRTTIIWAHVGLGRIVQPVTNHAATLDAMLSDPSFAHVHFDISSSEVAKYILASPQALEAVALLLNRYPDRFLFGSDEMAPTTQGQLLQLHRVYEPLWAALTPDTRERVRKGNYERLFDEARKKVRAWEQVNVKPANRTQGAPVPLSGADPESPRRGGAAEPVGAPAAQPSTPGAAPATAPAPAQPVTVAAPHTMASTAPSPQAQPASPYAPPTAASAAQPLNAPAPPAAVHAAQASMPSAPQMATHPQMPTAPQMGVPALAAPAQPPAMAGQAPQVAPGPAPQPAVASTPQPMVAQPAQAPMPATQRVAVPPGYPYPAAAPAQPLPAAPAPPRMVGTPPQPAAAPQQPQPTPWPAYQRAPGPAPQPAPYRPPQPGPQTVPGQTPVRVVSQTAP